MQQIKEKEHLNTCLWLNIGMSRKIASKSWHYIGEFYFFASVANFFELVVLFLSVGSFCVRFLGSEHHSKLTHLEVLVLIEKVVFKLFFCFYY